MSRLAELRPHSRTDIPDNAVSPRIEEALRLWGQNVFPASGNVGIGTQAPVTPLHIKQTSNALSGLLIERAGATNSWHEYVGGDNNLYVQSGANYSRFDANGNALFGLTGGNVGIGTTSPVNPLHVHVGTDQNLLVGTYQGAAYLQTVNDAVNVSTPMQFLGSQFTFSRLQWHWQCGHRDDGPKQQLDNRPRKRSHASC